MAITRISNSSLKTINKSDSLLAGNAFYNPIFADYLVVGAGGYADSDPTWGGGAGAGGGAVKTGSNYVLAPGATFTVTVAGTNSTVNTNGASSIFGTVTAVGGGYAASSSSSSGYNGQSGGNGGGARVSGSVTASFTGGTGTDGFNGASVSNSGSQYGYVNGGGGGAGGAGSAKQAGPGVSNSITGTAVFYGGGGNGIDFGGAGTTGSGATAYNTNGAANTGAGAGGAGSSGADRTGGSGIVVIAYPDTYPALTTIPGTLTYTQPTRSGYRVYRFTAGTGTVTV
jgi:hypothetical protein